jgi:hypothetical protein
LICVWQDITAAGTALKQTLPRHVDKIGTDESAIVIRIRAFQLTRCDAALRAYCGGPKLQANSEGLAPIAIHLVNCVC